MERAEQKACLREMRLFLSKYRFSTEDFSLLPIDLSEDVFQYREYLRARKFWKHPFLTFRFDRLLRKIENHNERVKTIIANLESIPIDDYYNTPYLVDEDKADEILEVCDATNDYALVPKNPYRQLVDRLRFFVIHLDEYRRQWNVWNGLRDLQKEVEDAKDFLFRPMLLSIQEKEGNLREQAKKFKELYYPISTIPSLYEKARKHNEALLIKWGQDPILDSINGISLDQQQRMAAVSPEPKIQVIAGAGSGKTTTICGRVKYLLQRQHASPTDFLLLSYSKKSADDLALKMETIDPNLTVGTFHKIGLDILKKHTGEKFVVEDQWDAIIEEFFRVEMKKDPTLMNDVLRYYALYVGTGTQGKQYGSEGELYEDLKRSDCTTLKQSLLKYSNDLRKKETIKKEFVKSYEEMALANFYFINGIDYEYERPYEKKLSTLEHRQYQPDFYLKDYKIYHEHFGIDAQGRAKQYKPDVEAEYLEGVQWKRQCHKIYGTELIETTSAQFADGSIFKTLEAELKRRGITFHPLSEQQVNEALESIYEGQRFKSFINLIKSFLSLYKSRYENDTYFEKLLRENVQYGYEKTRLFLDICKAVYSYYMHRIRSEGKIDFDDMILQSKAVLPLLPDFKFKYIIVDEFQDISYSRAMFLKALIRHGDSALFAVGDDWQSIYRFSGCDLNIFFHFADYFGVGERYYIESVHRNSQQLQDAAAKFIEANPEQIKKQIHSNKRMDNPLRLVFYRNDEHGALVAALAEISKFKEDAKVLLLGRNNKDINAYLSQSFYFKKDSADLFIADFPKLQLRYSTVHGSKGLEEDYVVLLSGKDAPNGFPNKTEDDPLLNLVMAQPSSYVFAEERRLWYVALTRTRNITYVIAPIDAPSTFIKEMWFDFLIVKNEEGHAERKIRCPKCKDGNLLFRETAHGNFLACSNYPYCRYTIDDFAAVKENKKCPECGDYLILKEGPYGEFYKCHNQYCQFKKNLRSTKKRWPKGWD